jgi:hypothetical protein
MRKTNEVLRLRFELGLGQRAIARACSISQSTVHDYLNRATAGSKLALLYEQFTSATRGCREHRANYVESGALSIGHGKEGRRCELGTLQSLDCPRPVPRRIANRRILLRRSRMRPGQRARRGGPFAT